MFERVLAMVAAVLVGAASGARAGEAERAPARLKVVATIAMIGDVAQEIGGERVEVTSLIGPGVDPHLYRATRSDMALLLGADLVLYNGLLLEGKMTDALVRIARSGRPVHAVSEGVPEDFLLEPEEYEGHYDPHVWMDPSGWMHAAGLIGEALAGADPAHAAEYATRTEAYIARLRGLDEYARRVLGSVPEGRRVLVTSHDAFNYFGRAYGFEVIGIQGISTVSEAGLRDIERIVEEIVRRGVPAVFTETTVSERNVRALVAGCRARGHALAVGGSLFSDAMGSPGTYRGTYIGMIDHNVTTIARALGGEAPEGGANGRLADGADAR